MICRGARKITMIRLYRHRKTANCGHDNMYKRTVFAVKMMSRNSYGNQQSLAESDGSIHRPMTLGILRPDRRIGGPPLSTIFSHLRTDLNLFFQPLYSSRTLPLILPTTTAFYAWSATACTIACMSVKRGRHRGLDCSDFSL